MNAQPIASSSRLLSTPARTTARKRAAAFRRTTSTSFAFVLTLCAPYIVAATPLPPAITPVVDSRTSSPHDVHIGLAESVVSATLSAFQATARATSALLSRHTYSDQQWARVEVATRSADCLYTMPSGYVELEQSLSPGFVVLSYVISFVGSLCTLELLLRRTSNRGVSNIILLATAGCCFGSVSTFAMHFVGNQALSLHHPLQKTNSSYATLYLTYSGGFTVLSLVASCLAMTFAFFVMGTHIHFSDWRSWPCVPGGRERRSLRKSSSSHQRDYARWKLRKAKKRSANVGTIFAQAGMIASWSLMDVPRPSQRRGWRSVIPDRTKGDLTTMGLDEGPFSDEDTMIKRNKELGEIDFRLGRSAVRSEIDRRYHLTSAPLSQLDSPSPSPGPSVNNMASNVSLLPTSPLAAYYPSRRDSMPQSSLHVYPVFDKPSPQLDVFTPGYSFPPRAPFEYSSTSELLPRAPNTSDDSPSGLWHTNDSPIPLEPVSSIVFPASAQRRASLPATTLSLIRPDPVSRVALTLSRIQSLPEPDAESSSRRTSEGTDNNDEPGNTSGTMNRLSRTETAGYEEVTTPAVRTGWRQRLKAKVQAGDQLSRKEKIGRFLALDIVTWADILKICITGMLSGWGVAAMHYIGQVSINDIPYIAYKVGYVVGSVIIASGAVMVALYIMFIMLRPKLKHSWASKIGVAIILAGAVCGMHYTAVMGTVYGWPDDTRPSTSSQMSGTKKAITGLVAALAFVACMGVAIFVMINSARDRKERARRRRVVVASVLLDDQDRVLVNAIDGLLPMCDIASLTSAEVPSSGNRKSGTGHSFVSESTVLGMDLTTAHEAFVQAVKMSWSWRNPFWSSMNPFALSNETAGGPADALAPATLAQPIYPSRRGSTVTSDSGLSHPIRLSISRFLEKFAISATQLSVRLTGQQEGISRLGVLYDQILTTGWVRLSNGTDTVSKGQLIFLVRRVVSSQERSDLLARHFIFADQAAVATSLHKTLSTPYEHVMPFLDDIRTFCDSTMRMSLRPNTLYAGVAIVQATPFDGLRILLENSNRSQLPMREVCTFSTLPGLPSNVTEDLSGTLEEIGEALTWLEGMNLLTVITRNMSTEATLVGGPRVGKLLSAIERSVVPLLDELLSQQDMAHVLPRLTLHPTLVPLTPTSLSRHSVHSWAAPYMIVFYANYDVAVNTFTDKWLPFSLFRAQHACVMAQRINAVTRAAAAATPLARAASPSISNPSELAKYNFGRRPSKVQFEIPPLSESSNLSSYSFPPSTDDITNPPAPSSVSPLFSSRDRQPPRRSSLAKGSGARDDIAPDVGSRDVTAPGVGTWDPDWLLVLLRTRLRADA